MRKNIEEILKDIENVAEFSHDFKIIEIKIMQLQSELQVALQFRAEESQMEQIELVENAIETMKVNNKKFKETVGKDINMLHAMIIEGRNNENNSE